MNFEPVERHCWGWGYVQHGRMGLKGQVGYQSDVADEEWAFVRPCLLLCREDSRQWKYDLRAVFNAVRLMRTAFPSTTLRFAQDDSLQEN
ncbi:MAG: hypothetical protein ABI380_15905 [Edaphobacter sp.]